MEALLFWIFALVGMACGVMVVWHRNPMGSAVYLVLTMLCLAGLYALLSGAFVAILQVLIYAGAVMVLILFVIMMLDARQAIMPREGSRPAWMIAALVGLIVVIKLATLFHQGHAPAIDENFGTIEGVGAQLFGPYVLPFELISVLLLIAIIGAVILAKRRTL
jgi:NADH-quinone oxidoreductase subunit J